MARTYHDFLEAAYHGDYRVMDPATGRYTKRGIPYKNDREGMASLAENPSYHFGGLQDIGAALDLKYAPQDCPDTREGDGLVAKVNDLLDTLRLNNVGLVYDDLETGSTIIIITCFDFFMNDYMVARHTPGDGWVLLDGNWITSNSFVFMRFAERSLEMLANPSVHFVMRDPNRAMETFSKNRVRRGEEPVADMKIVHLTKRIVIGGTTYGGHGGSQSEKSPHDRQGHWRHSEREIAGWEKVKPERGQYAGITMWRKWIDAFPVKGGKVARQSGQFADNAAPQFRVVR